MSFKSNTGDMRNTPAVKIANDLADLGAVVMVFDSLVKDEDFSAFRVSEICSNIELALVDSDMVAILSPHREILEFELARMKSLTSEKCWLFDGRRAYSPRDVIESGFMYSAIGGVTYEQAQ